jgi:hypothetical protein
MTAIKHVVMAAAAALALVPGLQRKGDRAVRLDDRRDRL